MFKKILKNMILERNVKYYLFLMIYMTADIINNKRLNPVATELFVRDRKSTISIVFITQSYFKVQKKVRIKTTHFFIMKIPNKREL